MPRPTRLVPYFVALAVVIAVIALVIVRPGTSVVSQVGSTTTVPCQSPRLNSDYQIDQCLETGIRTMTRRMNSSLRRESSYLRYASRAQDWRVAQRTQATFVKFAQEECISQANPYQPGTIVPILYGECVIQLDQQRFENIERAIATFKNGEESRRSS